MTFEYTLKQLSVNSQLNYDVAFNMMASAFDGGVADYCTMFEPVASTFQASGKGYIVASVGSQSGEIPYTCFMAKQSYIDKNEKKVEGLLTAVTKAIKFVYENDEGEIAKYLAPYFDGTDESAIKTSIVSYKQIDAWVDDMAMKKDAYERLLDVIESAGELKRKVAFEDLVLTKTAHEVYTKVYK